MSERDRSLHSRLAVVAIAIRGGQSWRSTRLAASRAAVFCSDNPSDQPRQHPEVILIRHQVSRSSTSLRYQTLGIRLTCRHRVQPPEYQRRPRHRPASVIARQTQGGGRTCAYGADPIPDMQCDSRSAAVQSSFPRHQEYATTSACRISSAARPRRITSTLLASPSNGGGVAEPQDAKNSLAQCISRLIPLASFRSARSFLVDARGLASIGHADSSRAWRRDATRPVSSLAPIRRQVRPAAFADGRFNASYTRPARELGRPASHRSCGQNGRRAVMTSHLLRLGEGHRRRMKARRGVVKLSRPSHFASRRRER